MEPFPLRLEIDTAAAVAVVTLDRPPVNALNRALRDAIRSTFQELSSRRDVNAVVLTGAGTRAFCAGVDLRERLQERDANGPKPLDPGKEWRDTKAAVLNCPVPVIGAINGPAIGAGLGLASVCDFLIASEHARFGLTEINVGLLGGGSALLRLVGSRYKMRRMFFTGELVGAEEMYRLGAVEAVVPQDRLLPEALTLAGQIATKSPIALRLGKESLNRLEELLAPFEEGYRLEQDYTNRLSTFEDAREGTAAFVERRAPEWKWR